MKTRIVAAVILSALAGCAGSSAMPGPAICSTQALPQVTMLSPFPNATAVPDGGFNLVLGASAAIVGTIDLSGGVGALAKPSGSTLVGIVTVYGTPPPVIAAYAVPSLSAKTTYKVTEDVAAGSACATQAVVGQFTTQ